MLESIQTRNSNLALKWDGKFVCSSIDPWREATLWVQKNKSVASRQRQVIVLGVGCGYHIVALQKEFPALHILAIDAHQEFIDFCLKEHGLDLSSVELSHIKNIQLLSNSPKISKILEKRYAVLKFGPSMSAAESFYSNAESLLLGRSSESAIHLSQIRNELSEILKSASRTCSRSELISIKTLANSMDPSTPAETVLAIKLLREMIA